MATKDYCLSPSDKIFVDNVPEKDRYNNLNLNQNHQYLSAVNYASSKHAKTDNNNDIQNNDLTGGFLQSKSNPTSWKSSVSTNIFQHDSDKKESKEKSVFRSSSNNNNSSLSLHITAYDNSVGATSSESSGENSKSSKKLIEKWKSGQQNFTASIHNCFEFPRQQDKNENKKPEVAQFKASQRLLNSRETPSVTDTTMRFVDSLAPDETTFRSNMSNNSATSITLTQNVWRRTNSVPNLKRKSQFIVTMATAESMTDIFPEWINFALYGTPGNRRYRPYDLNMPLAIPRRPESRYKLDPPLTEHGKVAASMTAMGILRNKLPFKIIYCAPEMASVQTANTVSLAASKKNPVSIRIEPALSNWRGFIKSWHGIQQWESKEYYSKLGYNIDLEYNEFLKDSDILQDETPRDFLQRKLDFFTKLVDENAFDCVLVIGHAATVCIAADGNWDTKTELLDIERSGLSCSVHGIHLGADGEHTHLTRPTLPFTPTLFDAQEKAKKSELCEREKPKMRYVKSFGLSNQSDSSEEEPSDQNTSQ